MSRSRRKPGCYECCGAHPREGKQKMSRWLRRRVRQEIHIDGEDYNFHHIQDKIRGHKGSKEDDYGWDYFGDGFWRMWGPGPEGEFWDKLRAKLSRK